MTWAAFRLLLAGVPRQVWIGLAVIAAVWFYGHLRYNAGQADIQAKFDAYKVEIQKAVSAREAANLAKEAADKQEFERIAKQHDEDVKNAKAKADRVAADLRDGIAKLQKHWRGCPSGQAAGSPQGIDEETRLREESAARIIGNAAEADSWITRLQEVIRQLQSEPPPAD
jgi:uncharacterized protein YukE